MPPLNSLRYYRRRYKIRLVALNCGGLVLALVLIMAAVPYQFFPPDYSAVLFDESQRVIGISLSPSQSWHFPPQADIPPKFRQALIAYEDRKFYQHWGVDLWAVGRAIQSNLRAGQLEEGASTITMQVARMALKHPQRAWLEKLSEILVALKMELIYSKDQILALYAAEAPFGGNVVGLEAAAWRYFARPAADLTWAESAMLAVLPNAPGLIHLERNRPLLLQKRNRLLDTLMQLGIISQDTCLLAKTEPLPGALAPMPRIAPHLLDSLSNGRFPTKNLSYPLYHSSLNSDLQRRLNQLASAHMAGLQGNGITNCAVVVIENQTGLIKAYLGNNPNLENQAGSWVDLVQRPRSTGSILKPFLYTAMVNEGALLPGQLVLDIPTRYPGFAPENASQVYRGAIPAWLALARSLNIPAVRMLKDYGVEKFAALLKKAGISTLRRKAEDYGLTLIIGGAEGTLWEMASLYAGLARQAQGQAGAFFPAQVLRTPRAITPANPVGIDLFSSGAANITVNALLAVNRPGIFGMQQTLGSSRPIAWKSGTSQGFRDAWAIGIDAQYTVAVWVGNANGEARPELGGTIAAGPLLFAVFDQVPVSPWFTPVAHSLSEIKVCAHSGLPLGPNCGSAQSVTVPVNTILPGPCPYCQTITLTADGQRRTNLSLEGGRPVLQRAWFVLPPVAEWYYRQNNADYQLLPPEKPGMRADKLVNEMEIQYPEAASQVILPRDFNGEISPLIAEAVHRRTGVRIYWHLDETYLGSTEFKHSMALQPTAGEHVLTLVDQFGETDTCRFLVLDRN